MSVYLYIEDDMTIFMSNDEPTKCDLMCMEDGLSIFKIDGDKITDLNSGLQVPESRLANNHDGHGEFHTV